MTSLSDFIISPNVMIQLLVSASLNISGAANPLSSHQSYLDALPHYFDDYEKEADNFHMLEPVGH